MPVTADDLSNFVEAYMECLFWQAGEIYDENGESTGERYDDRFSWEDLSEADRLEARDDCEDFVCSNKKLLSRYPLGPAHAAHDFCLTRNRHGAGFWDRGLGKLGQELADASHPYGSQTVYVGDDDCPHLGSS